MHSLQKILVKAENEGKAQLKVQDFLNGVCGEYQQPIDYFRVEEVLDFKKNPKEIKSRIEGALKSQEEVFNLDLAELFNEKDNITREDLKATYNSKTSNYISGFIPYALSKVALTLVGNFTMDSYFYDLEEQSAFFPNERKEHVYENCDDYYLVIVDTHGD